MRAVVVAMLLASSTAAADPRTRLALTGGRRETLGALGDRWSGGWVRGVEAGVQPAWIGFSWAILWTTIAARAPQTTLTSVDVWQIDAAARARGRVPLGLPAQTFLYLQLGATLQRTEVPLDDGGGAGTVGGIGGAGVEVSLGGVQIGLGVNGAVHVSGLATLDVRLSIGYGRVETK